MRPPRNSRLPLTADVAGLTRLIEEMAQAGATDLHIKVPGRPQVRVEGALVPMPYERVNPAETYGFAQAVMELAGEPEPFASVRDARVAFAIDGVGRFRGQVARQRGSFEIVIHRVQLEAPRVEEFPGLSVVGEAFSGPRGLFLVGGGRQRRAALAAIIRSFNEQHWGRLVSIEDPIDWLHRDARASISQREMGTDVSTFREGLACALRQDADAVVVTDVPTVEDAEIVLRAAEDGLFVFAGMPMAGADDAMMSFAGRFPVSREREVVSRVASVLRGIVLVESDGSVTWRTVDAAGRAALRAGRLTLVG